MAVTFISTVLIKYHFGVDIPTQEPALMIMCLLNAFTGLKSLYVQRK